MTDDHTAGMRNNARLAPQRLHGSRIRRRRETDPEETFDEVGNGTRLLAPKASRFFTTNLFPRRLVRFYP
jgi:hypothetical protein